MGRNFITSLSISCFQLLLAALNSSSSNTSIDPPAWTDPARPQAAALVDPARSMAEPLVDPARPLSGSLPDPARPLVAALVDPARPLSGLLPDPARPLAVAGGRVLSVSAGSFSGEEAQRRAALASARLAALEDRLATSQHRHKPEEGDLTGLPTVAAGDPSVAQKVGRIGLHRLLVIQAIGNQTQL